MAMKQYRLTDSQWAAIEPIVMKGHRYKVMGRPRANQRATIDAILWVLRTGAPWKAIPKEGYFPCYSSCFKHFARMQEEKLWHKIMTHLLLKLDSEGKLQTTEVVVDGTFAGAKKGVKKPEKQFVASQRK